jgi:hypothetical protein
MMSWWRAAVVAAAIGVLAAAGPAGAVDVQANAGTGTATLPAANVQVALGAFDADAPSPTDESQVTNVTWSWQITSVDFSASCTCAAGVVPVDQWSVTQPDPATADATLDAVLTAAGTYKVGLLCIVTYTLSDGTTETGSDSTDALLTVTGP